LDQCKYAFGYLFNKGSGPTSWQRKLQDLMAQWTILKKISWPCRGYQKIIMVVSFVGRNGLSTLETNDNIL
jgi:hypothetical protein